jgi:hypothetical protein
MPLCRALVLGSGDDKGCDEGMPTAMRLGTGRPICVFTEFCFLPCSHFVPSVLPKRPSSLLHWNMFLTAAQLQEHVCDVYECFRASCLSVA